jgi:ATP-dependent Clp protease ATP-binding subunit ClpA
VVFERFTESARQIVVTAQSEARELNHGYIGTEHELLGLLADRDRTAGRVLSSAGITYEQVREQVMELVRERDERTEGQIPFTPEAKKVLELALREVLTLRHSKVHVEHVLLGLLLVREGLAMRILLDSGVDPYRMRDALIKLLPGPDRDPPTRAAALSRPDDGIRFTAVPDAQTRLLLMKAAARALSDGRAAFLLTDLLAALWDDEQARGALAGLVTGELAGGEETEEGRLH